MTNDEKRMSDYSLGCKLPVAEWVHLNRTAIFANPALRKYVSPFPPPVLMQNTSGLTSESDFASHGSDFWIAFSQASPRPLSEFASILDFGCGCGRLARMFKGHPGRIAGCDIDQRHVKWCSAALEYMETKLSSVRPPIPFADSEFDAVISISVFTHLNESSSEQFLQELARVCRPDGMLFLTIHGRRALHRAISEPPIRAMLNVGEDLFQAARQEFSKGRHAFILQHGHLTTVGKTVLERLVKRNRNSDSFEYGITFVPEDYVRTKWSQWFDVVDYRVGALHDFQDIVVLRPKKNRLKHPYRPSYAMRRSVRPQVGEYAESAGWDRETTRRVDEVFGTLPEEYRYKLHRPQGHLESLLLQWAKTVEECRHTAEYHEKNAAY